MSASCANVSTGGGLLLAVYRGDTLRLQVRLTDKDAKPVDVTGWTFLSQLRRTNDSLVTEIDVLIVSAVDGELEMYIDNLDTAMLDPADYLFDLEAKDVASDVRTVLSGRLRVRPDVSRVVPT